MLALYGHPFSSYTWKALIALYANDTAFTFRVIGPDHPEHSEELGRRSPIGKFPLLVDGDRAVFESTAIIEYLDLCYPGTVPLLPRDPLEAVEARMLDRVLDNYVMEPMSAIVTAHIRSPGSPDADVIARARATLDRTYPWLDGWLGRRGESDGIGLIECAAAPSLFYADWVHPIPAEYDRLGQWRKRLLALPAVARCVDDARPYRPLFPPGAPDRD
ncbi:MAG: glutathione S-transferase family protein [Novosphingobium sp.]